MRAHGEDDPAAPLPEEHLAAALAAEAPEGRIQAAERGLDDPQLDGDTHVLLLRQVYLAHLELGQLDDAADTAEAMAAIGPLRDVAYTDLARARQALGDTSGAIEAQRLAARNAPPDRRSFQLWSLATLQHFAGDHDAARDSLGRGLRYATDDRPLLRAQDAWVALETGELVEDLEDIRQTLANARCGQGYGQFVLGMIAHELGDLPAAMTHLRAFLRRNARVDVAKGITLREELRRARAVLASLTSS